MKSLSIAFKSITHKPLHTLLSVLILAIGCGLIMLVLSARDSLENRFTQNIKDIDMVVGAKGSPLQIILSSVYHIDAPTGNISLTEFEKLSQHRLVKAAIPLSYGDNYRGYRILGTDTNFRALYDLHPARGDWPSQNMKVIVGARAAYRTSLKVGDTFEGSHGLSEEGEEHHRHPYTVAGILKPCNCVADKLIITPLASVWTVHQHNENETPETPEKTNKENSSPSNAARKSPTETPNHEEEHHATANSQDTGHGEHTDHRAPTEKHHQEDEERQKHEEQKEHEEHEEHDPREITAGLIAFSSPFAQMSLPRMVNSQTDMQAALPSIELNRLFSLMSNAITFVNALAILLMILAAASVFIALYQNLRDEEPQMAYLRAIGASRWQLFSLITTKGLTIALLGYLLGWSMNKAGLFLISQASQQAYQTSLAFQWVTIYDIYILGAIIAVGILAALFPAIRAYRLNISKTLANA